MNITIKGSRANLKETKSFLASFDDLQVEGESSLTVTLKCKTGNAKFVQYLTGQIKYVARQYKCSATAK